MALEKTGTNVGSLCKIEIVNTKLVASMPDAYEGQVIGDITLHEGAEWENIYFTQDTAHFVEQPRQVDGAEVYELVVKWKVPKDRATALQYLLQSSHARFVARLKDVNGATVLAGTPDEGCRMLSTMRDKGQNIRDSNHYIVELRLTRSEPSPIL